MNVFRGARSRAFACSFLFLLAPMAAAESVDVDKQLPKDALAYFEFRGIRDAGAWFEGSHALELWHEEEVQEFLKPALDGIRSDFTYLIRKAPEPLRKQLLSGDFGKLTISLLRIGIDAKKGEPKQVEVVVTLDVGAQSADLFAALRKFAVEEEPEDTIEITVAGRPGLASKSHKDDQPVVELLQDGERWVARIGYGVEFSPFFDRQGDSLADDEGYRKVKEKVAGTDSLVFAYAKLAGGLFDVIGSAMEAGMDEKAGQMLRRMTFDKPEVAGIKASGYGVVREGKDLRDRVFVYAPGDRSGWPKSGKLGDAPQRHAAFADADADVFGTTWFDLADYIHRAAQEEERAKKLAAEVGVSDEMKEKLATNVIEKALAAIKEKTGVDVEKDVAPLLGTFLSGWVALPSAGLSVPDFGLVLDVKDGAAFDALMEKLLAADLSEVSVKLEKQDADGRTLYIARLINLSAPIIPSLCRVDDKVLLAATPQALKGLLAAIAKQKTLAATEGLGAAVKDAPQDAGFAAWIDLETTVNYLYGFVGLALTAMKQQKLEDVADRFDPALLPSAEAFSKHLAMGSFVMREEADGFVYEGKSALGNPVLGSLAGAMGISALIGGSIGLKEQAGEQRREESSEHLRDLAKLLEQYKSSFGNGSYPENLVSLVDRGLLKDTALLVDPSDANPKKVKLGSGERAGVSYAIGSIDLLPAKKREGLPPEAKSVIYTRDPFHRSNFGDKVRLALVLGAPDAKVIRIDADEWAKK